MQHTDSVRRLRDAQWLADHLGLALQTVAMWRCRGVGPRWVRLGRRIAYDPSDVDAWVERQKVSSTSANVSQDVPAARAGQKSRRS